MAIVWTDNLINIRRRLAVASVVTTRARQVGLHDRAVAEVRRYALGKLKAGDTAHRAIKAGKVYAAVRAGLIRWPRPPQGAA
jgi:predicted metal-binding protein